MTMRADGVMIACLALPCRVRGGDMGVTFGTRVAMPRIMVRFRNAGSRIDRTANQQQRSHEHHAKAWQGKDRLESHRWGF